MRQKGGYPSHSGRDRRKPNGERFIDDLRESLGRRRQYEGARLLVQIEQGRAVGNIAVKCDLLGYSEFCNDRSQFLLDGARADEIDVTPQTALVQLDERCEEILVSLLGASRQTLMRRVGSEPADIFEKTSNWALSTRHGKWL